MSDNEQKSDILICPCGSEIKNKRININLHAKTLKHKKFLEDGINNPLPQPSTLDLQGITPPQYLNNLPEGGTLIGDTNIATPFG